MAPLSISLIEDSKFTVKDIKDEVDNKKFDIVELDEPEHLLDLFHQLFFRASDGVLIDIDLQHFGCDEIFIGSKSIYDGVDIAQYLYEFNPRIPIAVYSAFPEEIEKRKGSLDDDIIVLPKDERQFEEILEPFYEEVAFRKKQKGLGLFPRLEEFIAFNQNQKRNFYKKSLSHVNANKYFEAIGDYAWFIECNGVVKGLHGPVIGPGALSEDQKHLAERHGIEPVKEILPDAFEVLTREKGHLPFIFWNLRTIEHIKANLHFFADTLLKNMEPGWRKLFFLQVAESLAALYVRGEAKVEQVEDILKRIDNFGRYEFQKILLNLRRDDLGGAGEASQVLEPFERLFENRISDIFTGYVDKLEKETDTAWIIFENLFDDEIEFVQPLSLSSLNDNGIFGKGAEFNYIVYINDLGHPSFDIEPVGK